MDFLKVKYFIKKPHGSIRNSLRGSSMMDFNNSTHDTENIHSNVFETYDSAYQSSRRSSIHEVPDSCQSAKRVLSTINYNTFKVRTARGSIHKTIAGS